MLIFYLLDVFRSIDLNSEALTSAAIQSSNSSSDNIVINTSTKLVQPEEIRPYPKAEPKKRTSRGRKPGVTKIVTDTPEKENIKIMKEKRKSTNTEKSLTAINETAKKK